MIQWGNPATHCGFERAADLLPFHGNFPGMSIVVSREMRYMVLYIIIKHLVKVLLVFLLVLCGQAMGAILMEIKHELPGE